MPAALTSLLKCNQSFPRQRHTRRRHVTGNVNTLNYQFFLSRWLQIDKESENKIARERRKHLANANR